MTFEIAIIGLVLSLVYIVLTGYYPGGIIVPSYLVLFTDQPLRLIGTLIASIIAFLLYRALSSYLILFGKRRFVMLILLGALASLSLSLLLPILFPSAIELRVIGWVIPGLIASSFDRQGVIITTSSLAIVLTVLFFTGRLYFLILN